MVIHIYYRHTPVQRLSGKNRPAWFSHEKCFLNLFDTMAASLQAGAIHFHLVFDGSEDDLQSDFAIHHMDRFKAQHPESASAFHVHRIAGGDQRKAWRACVGLVKQHCDEKLVQPGDLIYLLENDYVHRPGWTKEVMQLAEQGIRWEYLTFYDHPDKYPNLCGHVDARHYLSLRSAVFATPHRHWRTTPSTCATYMLSRETFLRDHPLLRMGLFDFRLFRVLTKLSRRRLLSPMPALATHSMSEFLSPCVDWEREITRGRED